MHPALRQSRGCLKTPERPDIGTTWNPETFLEGAPANDKVTEHLAEEEYSYATVGKVFSRWGFLWPYCPRSPVEFASEPVKARAMNIIRLARAAKDGYLSEVLSQPLTEAGLVLIQKTQKLWSDLQDEYDVWLLEQRDNSGDK